jgi:tellurite resistance protein
MRESRLGAAIAGYALGVSVAIGSGNVVALGAGVALAGAFATVAHVDDRLGWSVTAGAGGALAGALAGGGPYTLVGAGAAVALGVAVGALAWKFPRGTLPIATSVLGGLLVVALLTAQDAGSGGETTITNGLVAAVVLSAFVGLMIQPWSAELGDTVPPLLPLTVRNWFDLVPEGGVGDAVCPTCGEGVNPNAPYCANCDASLAGMVGPVGSATTTPGAADGTAADDDATIVDVPADAAAIDVPCPDCGDRPIEETATGVGLVGMLLAYKWSKRTVVGCHQCNRRRLWGLAGKNLVLGWWSILSLFANPFTVLWNVGRGAVNRGPTTELARTLAQAGVDFQYISDPTEFDASTHAENELLQRGLLRLGVAVMLVDGHADPSEAAAIRDTAAQLFPDADRDDLEARIQAYAGETTNATKVANGLADTLTGDGRRLALRFAAAVAVADGDVDDDEAALLSTLADALDLDDADVQAAIGEGVTVEDAPEPASAV